jgi:hypothetical protein
MSAILKRLFGRDPAEVRQGRRAAKAWEKRAAELEKEADGFVHDGAAHDATSIRIWEDAMARVQLLLSWGAVDAVPAFRTQAGLAALLETTRRDLNYDAAAILRQRSVRLRTKAVKVGALAERVLELSSKRQSGAVRAVASASTGSPDAHATACDELEVLLNVGEEIARSKSAEVLHNQSVIRSARSKIADISARLEQADRTIAGLKGSLEKLALGQRKEQLVELLLGEAAARAEEAAFMQALEEAVFQTKEPRAPDADDSSKRIPPCLAKAIVILARAGVSSTRCRAAFPTPPSDEAPAVLQTHTAPEAATVVLRRSLRHAAWDGVPPGMAGSAAVVEAAYAASGRIPGDIPALFGGLDDFPLEGSPAGTKTAPRSSLGGGRPLSFHADRSKPRSGSGVTETTAFWGDGLTLACDVSGVAPSPLADYAIRTDAAAVVETASVDGGEGEDASLGTKSMTCCNVLPSMVAASVSQTDDWHWLHATASTDHPAAKDVSESAARAVSFGAVALPRDDADEGAEPPGAARSRAWRDLCALRDDAFACAGSSILSRKHFLEALSAMAAGLGICAADDQGGPGKCGVDLDRVWLAECLRLRRARRFRSLLTDQRLREGRLLQGWSMRNLSHGVSGLHTEEEACMFLGASAVLPPFAPHSTLVSVMPLQPASAYAVGFAAARGAIERSPAPPPLGHVASRPESESEEVMSPASQALTAGAAGAASGVMASLRTAPRTPPAAPPGARSAVSTPGTMDKSLHPKEDEGMHNQLETVWKDLCDAVNARQGESREEEMDTSAASTSVIRSVLSGPSFKGESLEARDEDMSKVPTPRVVRAVVEYLQGELRIAYSLKERWLSDVCSSLALRQSIRDQILPIVVEAEINASIAQGKGEELSWSPSLRRRHFPTLTDANKFGPAVKAALAIKAGRKVSSVASSPDSTAEPLTIPDSMAWVPSDWNSLQSSLRRLVRSIVFARLARAAAGGIRDVQGHRVAVGGAPRTAFLERMWSASLRAAPRIPLSRLEMDPDFLAPIDWAPWFPPYLLSGRVLAAMDAEVSCAGLGDPGRIKDILITAVETVVWEAGERKRSAIRARGKVPKRVDLGAEDLLPLLVLTVSRSVGGYDPEAEMEANYVEAIGGAVPMADPAFRCPWRLPLQTLNYMANFAIGKDSSAGRVSYLVITLHGAITYVMQRAKEVGAEHVLNATSKARRLKPRVLRAQLTSVGGDAESRASTPKDAALEAAQSSPFTDSMSDDDDEGSSAAPDEDKTSPAASERSDTDPTETPTASAIPATPDMLPILATGVTSPQFNDDAQLDDLERVEAETAAQTLKDGPKVTASSSAAEELPVSPEVSGSEDSRQVRVDVALRRLASIRSGAEGAGEDKASAWSFVKDAAAGKAVVGDDDEDDDDTVGDEAPNEEELLMIAMPGEADTADNKGMQKLAKWLGQQELLEDTVEMLT